MGTCIESVATAFEHGGFRSRSALRVIDQAATTCLSRAHAKASQLDLLINAGLYKEANAAEPALATIIQEDIGANPGPTLLAAHGTFSFDILNGGCGVVTAARLVDAFVAHGPAQHAMIVAGDVDPSPSTSHRFPFSSAGGAMLVGHVEGDHGFKAFELRTFPAYADLYDVTLHWEPRAGLLHRGRNILDVHEEPSFGPRCTELATAVASAFLTQHDLKPSDVDLLITSQYPRTIAVELAQRLGISWTCVPRVRRELARSHTAGPLVALEAAFESGQFKYAHRTLFVTVGAGITVGVALYENASPV